MRQANKEITSLWVGRFWGTRQLRKRRYTTSSKYKHTPLNSRSYFSTVSKLDDADDDAGTD